MRDAAINGVSNPGLSFISNSDDGLVAIRNRYVQQQLGHVAGSEHLVNGGEAGRSLLRAEVRGEDAIGGALPPQELACPAG